MLSLRVTKLWVKPASKAAMLGTDTLVFSSIIGGVEGSIDVDPQSPRQVLLGSASDRSQMMGATERLRWNLELDHHELAPGDIVEFEGGLALWLSMTCESCKTLTGIADWHQLGPRRGVFGVVLSDGVLQIGNAARVIRRTSALSDDRAERIAQSLQFIGPNDRSDIRLTDLLRWAGIQTVYARAFPKYLPRVAELVPEHVERIVRSDGSRFVEGGPPIDDPVSYTHLTLPTNREV